MAKNFGQSLRMQVPRLVMKLVMRLRVGLPMKLLRDERAQATTEYILMLMVAVSFFMLLYTKLISPVLSTLGTTISQQIKANIFNGNFHQLNIGH
jgi:hypothetical protein